MQVEVPEIPANFHLPLWETLDNLDRNFPPLATLQIRNTASVHQHQSVFDELVQNGPVDPVSGEKGAGLDVDELHHTHQGHDGPDHREHPAEEYKKRKSALAHDPRTEGPQSGPETQHGHQDDQVDGSLRGNRAQDADEVAGVARSPFEFVLAVASRQQVRFHQQNEENDSHQRI